jgi:FG-GAP-like repeat
VENGRGNRNIKGKEFKRVDFPPRPMKVSVGACWGDFDSDGFLDLYVGGFEANDAYQPNAIFRNQGDGTFKEIWRTKDKLQPAVRTGFCCSFFQRMPSGDTKSCGGPPPNAL